MEVDALLRIAREIVGKVAFAVSITNGADGAPGARIVQTSSLSETWTLQFMTNRRSRKVAEIERSGRMTMLYQLDQDGAYVTLVGNARINDSVETKRAIWSPASLKMSFSWSSPLNESSFGVQNTCRSGPATRIVGSRADQEWSNLVRIRNPRHWRRERD
jgi:general stress protein 26